MKFNTLDDFDFNGKTVILRVDINSPLDPQTLEIIDDSRIREHSETINELLRKNAKVVILGHQGRKGDPDFSDFSKHYMAMLKYVKNLKYVNDIVGVRAINAIRELKPGEALLLENVRMIDEETETKTAEEHARGVLVSALAPLADIFVNDAFSASHRAHASIVGFTAVLPSAAGRVMERELKALEKVVDNPSKPCLYVLGGAKAKETFKVIENVLDKRIADKVLLGGMISQVFHEAAGFRLGSVNSKLIEEKGLSKFRESASRILSKHFQRVMLPYDYAVDINGDRVEYMVSQLPVENLLKDIGSETIRVYCREISNASTIVFNGPVGVFEEEAFARGTIELYRAAASSKAFTVVGGGHSISALEKAGVYGKISFVSTAGGALISYLSGEKLPGVEALKTH
ncbi:MAG: phosphoglycerate kinase [Nitrososphaerota archaeon]|nr:phosphoglycerate kinase [Nitrososphaerota archaeon]